MEVINTGWQQLLSVDPSMLITVLLVLIGIQIGGLEDCFNSSPPSAAYMRLWYGSTLVQIMACRLDDANPLSEPMLTHCQLEPQEHFSKKFYLKSIYFYKKNAFEHVGCEMAAILSRERRVNIVTILHVAVVLTVTSAVPTPYQWLVDIVSGLSFWAGPTVC